MAKWTVVPETDNNSLAGTIKYDGIGENSYWEIQQDVTHIKKELERDRDMLQHGRENKHGMRKMCTIPDVIAVEMLTKFNLDVHSPTFMADPNNMKRLRYILKTEYPQLLLST